MTSRFQALIVRESITFSRDVIAALPRLPMTSCSCCRRCYYRFSRAVAAEAAAKYHETNYFTNARLGKLLAELALRRFTGKISLTTYLFLKASSSTKQVTSLPIAASRRNFFSEKAIP